MPSLQRPGLAALAFVAVNGVVVAGLWAGAGLPLLALAVLLPLAVGLTRRPQRGLLLLAALVPFDGLLLLPNHLPSLAAGWKEALVLATLAATFVAPADSRATRARAIPGWAPAVGGMLVVAAVSAVSVGRLQAVWGLKIDFFFLLVAIAVWRCPFDESERDALVTILMVTGFVTAVYGLAQQVLGPARLNALGYEYNATIRTTRGLLRSFSTFDNPFAFGFFLMLVLLIGGAHALARPDRLRSRLFLLAAPVLLGALAVTFVRGAWLGLVVGLAYLGWARFPRLLVALPLLVVAALVLPSGVASAAFSSSSGAERVAGWQANLTELTHHPFGLGLGSSNAAAEKAARSPAERQNVYHPDNEYYRDVYELGVLGLWFTVLLLASAFLGTRALSADRASDSALFALAVSATVLGAAAASLVATYFDTFPNNVYFWMLLGIVAAEAHAGGVPEQPATTRVPVRA